MVSFEVHHQLQCEPLNTPRPNGGENRKKVDSDLQLAALRMSAVDTPTALAFEVAAPRVE